MVMFTWTMGGGGHAAHKFIALPLRRNGRLGAKNGFLYKKTFQQLLGGFHIILSVSDDSVIFISLLGCSNL